MKGAWKDGGLAEKLLRYAELRLELAAIQATDQLRVLLVRILYLLAVVVLSGIGLVFLTVATAGYLNRTYHGHTGDWVVALSYLFLAGLLILFRKRLLFWLMTFLGNPAKPVPLNLATQDLEQHTHPYPDSANHEDHPTPVR